MSNDERHAIYDEMNRVIAALHTVNFAEQGLAGYGKPGNYFERQIGRWSKQYMASITKPIADNKTASGQALNRRVVFYIEERAD